jgi:tetratricopeptide (TPR) repeat protein
VTYRNADVIAYAADFVNVHVNAEKDSTTAQKYRIAGFPTVILTNSDGSEIDRIFGYAEAPDFIETINDYKAGRNTLADYLSRVEADPSSSMYYLIADKYTGRMMYDKSEEFYNRIIESDPTNEQGYSDSALFSLGQMKTRAREFEIAEGLFKSFPEKFPKSDLADDAMYEMAKTMRRAERFDDAIAAFKNFMKVWPESDLYQDAELYIPFCHSKKGDGEEAVKLFKKFLADYPDHDDVEWVKEQIDKIENPPAEGEES